MTARSLTASPAAPLLVALLAHATGLSGEFLSDDLPDIVLHPVVGGDAPAWHVLQYNYMGAPIEQGANTLRPAATLLFAGIWALFGEAPWAFRGIALLLHLATVLAGWRLARRWLPAGPAS